MNRLIIIGNGFDLAHGLKTSYLDFINDYWESTKAELSDKIKSTTFHSPKIFEDGFIQVNLKMIPFEQALNMEYYAAHQDEDYSGYKTKYREFRAVITGLNNELRQIGYKGDAYFDVIFTNKFFESLNEKSALQNWIDIEQEYYNQLKSISLMQNNEERNASIAKLNSDFEQIKTRLEAYLTQAIKSADKEKYRTLPSIKSATFPRMNARTFILNFNYTHTYEELYRSSLGNESIINIHGSLGDRENPIIFGYGDEMDESYARIEALNNNDFLDNIKSINYMMTDNYDKLMSFLEEDDYQVLIMGHSCGNSDCILLNSIFEHPHCAGIHIYYYQYENDGKIVDDYKDKVKNISRLFKNKPSMRGRIVNYKACKPLVPLHQDQ